MALDYFFDGQLRRYILQFVRVFGGFQWESGKDVNGIVVRKIVPATYAQRDRLVLAIIANNSTNTILAAPQITVWIKDLAVDRARTQAPNFIGKISAQERHFDPNTQEYTDQPGYLYQVERYMARPFELTLQVDIWTTNELQKQQLLEQILILFDPSLDLQTDVNALDWASLTIMELTGITYSSRTVPIGTGNTYDTLDIATLIFRVPIWINPPAKVKKSALIREIITNVVQGDTKQQIPDETGRTDGMFFTADQILARVITTFSDFKVKVSGNNVTLLTTAESNIGADGEELSWHALLTRYGEVRPNVSMLRLKTDNDLENTATDITGVIQLDPNIKSNLFWSPNVDTLPVNTLPPINAIIAPHQVYPGHGLPDAAIGQRYLMLDAIGTPTVAFGDLVCNANDIIAWDGLHWDVIFDSVTQGNSIQYLVNIFTNVQLKWNGQMWHNAVDGIYNNGYWSVFL